MFDDIAGSYDLLNHLLSLNIDRRWRKTAIRSLQPFDPKQILDVATGTGDLAMAALALNPDQVTGVDASPGMLAVAWEKIRKKGLEKRITLIEAACEELPFSAGSFDAALVAFGIRNFDDPLKGLREIHRVLKPGGHLVILEFSLPKRRWFLQLYRFYFHRILPLIGKVISRDTSAYRYLPESVEGFPKGEGMVALMNLAGFSKSAYKPLTAGICGLYTGGK